MTTHDPETIRRLVAEVIGRLLADSPRPLAAAPASVASTVGQQPQGAQATIPDTVITLATVARLPAGTKRVVIAAKAVVTPSAREFARDAGFELMRGAASAPPASPARPFLVAHAECAGDANLRCAAIARGVPGAQQLPATGLADVVAALAAHASRDGARGVLLCGRPAVAVALANRSAGVRAVTSRDAAGLLAAAAECAANLIVVDPKTFPAAGLDRVCGDFASRDLGVAPRELASPAPTPCSCQGHAHP